MAQSNFEERIDTYEIESTNVMTGDRDQSRYLYYQLKMSMAKAKQIDIIVSFLMESGVRMLLNDMKRALDRGVKIRILTGNYLGITQPSALSRASSATVWICACIMKHHAHFIQNLISFIMNLRMKYTSDHRTFPKVL